MVARPLWERKVVGSNPATPPTTGKIALREFSPPCRYYAKCVPVCLMYRARSAKPPPRAAEQNPPKKSATKETEP